MKQKNGEFKQLVYDLMNGSLNLKDYPVKESQVVTNEFEDGQYCEKLYSEAFDASRRLNEKLGTDEDKDVEFVISGFLDSTHQLCMYMFDCGYSGSEETALHQDSYDLFTHIWITKAYNRICKRLGKDRDEDLSIMISNYSNIMHFLGMKMYNYGIYFSKSSC